MDLPLSINFFIINCSIYMKSACIFEGNNNNNQLTLKYVR
jgi:hypothetical protein